MIFILKKIEILLHKKSYKVVSNLPYYHNYLNKYKISVNDIQLQNSGEMAERLNALVLKTSKGATPSRVRIPVSPPLSNTYARI